MREAQDAIPKNGILVTDAYEELVAELRDYPERLPEFDEHWSEWLAASREAEKKLGHDPEAFDEDLERYWHLRKEANLFLRLEIEAQRLIPCVRDPQNGDILKLRANDWIPAEWDEYIPSGIWSDHIEGRDSDAPGPQGSLLHGALRPVFFLQDEFDTWKRDRLDIVADHAPTISRPPASVESKIQRDAVKEAVQHIWEGSIPAGIRAKARDKQINDWLARAGRQVASASTIKRALSEMRVERN
jgi:hypothetical protein